MTNKLPPYSEEAERCVIGCCLIDPATCIPEASLVITTAEYFYDARCQRIWQVIISMHPSDVNLVTVFERLKSTLPAAHTILSQAMEEVHSPANLSSWLEMLQSKFTLRQIIKLGVSICEQAYDTNDADELLANFERMVLKIRPAQRASTDIRALLNQAVSIIEYRAQNWGAITGLSTGLIDLDQKTDGLHQGELIVLAAFPSCGKTALAVNIAVHNALAGIPVGILSAEMRPAQLVIRSLCSESRVNFKHISEPDVVKIIPQVNRLSKAPIYIQQCNGWTIAQAQAQARRWHHEHGIKLIAADYIQKFGGTGDNKEQQVASVGAGFKDLAMELEIPALALSQLNDDGRLRDSRALGQDGDSVWKLKNNGPWKPDIQPIKLNIEKCRDGETGEVDLTFFKTITRFESATKQPNDYQSPTND